MRKVENQALSLGISFTWSLLTGPAPAYSIKPGTTPMLDLLA